MRALPFLLMSFVLTTNVVARGPMTHERTDTPHLPRSTTGRYMYLGNVPKFDGAELELTISKMNLTARVKAHVNQARIDGYANQLFLRWKNVNEALMDTRISVHPLVDILKLAEKKSPSIQAWARIASQYSKHVLEETNLPVLAEMRNSKNFVSTQAEDDYKDLISQALFTYYFQTSESADDIISDSQKLENLLSVNNSRRLFHIHLGHLYTDSAQRDGYLGTLTFVYPIAATVEGPFDQPKEQVTDLKTAESIEARWWSNKWKDEFGGFPFLLIEWSGVAFHGPITTYSPLDIWYLRRGYVSHGCHRMDGSDVLELRALMPFDLKKAAKKIRVTILDSFDVTDWNRDGKLEAIDVKYYHIPTSVTVANNKTIEETIAPFLVEAQSKIFMKNNKYAAKFYDAQNDILKNVPRYKFSAGSVVKDGLLERVDIFRFDYRPSRILQYTEEGVRLQGFDDNLGLFPPRVFQKF